MEIVVTIIVAVCILMAWGPRVLLAVIVGVPILWAIVAVESSNRYNAKTVTAKPFDPDEFLRTYP